MTNHRQQAIDLYRSGLSMNATAKAIGVTGPTVRRWLEASGVSIRYSRPTYAAETRDRAIALYAGEQMSCAAVARAIGLKPFTVKQWVKDARVTRTMSDAASLAVLRGDLRAHTTGRMWHVSSKNGRKTLAESSLEYLRMEILDQDESVVSWGRCPHRIAFTDPQGKERHYIPDLVVEYRNGDIHVEEVKPRGRLAEPMVRAKIAAAVDWCAERGLTFRTISEEDVGYERRTAPSSLTKEESRARTNAAQRARRARETDEQRAARRAKSAAYAREWRERKRTQAAS